LPSEVCHNRLVIRRRTITLPSLAHGL
jgi:hypothetical protein